MGIAINHFIGGMVTPLNVGVCFLLVGLLLLSRVEGEKCRRMGRWVLSFGGLWLWLWSTGGLYAVLGRHLEWEFPPKLAEEYPPADVIHVLGGGMGVNTNSYCYAEMNQCADRVWQGARLWKAGKAPVIICSGNGAKDSTVPFLCEMGVPEDKVICLDASNTEGEARRIGDLFTKDVTNSTVHLHLFSPPPARPKVLLVTSVWHMRRAKLLFEQHSGCEIIPAPCDYECLVSVGENMAFDWRSVLPSAAALNQNSILFKEYFAYWCYRLKFFFRRRISEVSEDAL